MVAAPTPRFESRRTRWTRGSASLRTTSAVASGLASSTTTTCRTDAGSPPTTVAIVSSARYAGITTAMTGSGNGTSAVLRRASGVANMDLGDEVTVLLDDDRPRVRAVHERATRGAQLRPERAIGEEQVEERAELVVLAIEDAPAGPPRQAPQHRRAGVTEDRPPGGPRFERDDREALEPARHDEDVRRRVRIPLVAVRRVAEVLDVGPDGDRHLAL